MLKILFLFNIFFIFTFARVIGGISVLVNGLPITTYEIKNFAKEHHVSLNEALSALIQQKLEEIEEAKAGIIATPEEVENEMLKLAQKNNLDLATFQRRVIQSGKSLDELKRKIANKIKKDKLYAKILQGSLQKPTEEDLKRFYELHKRDLNVPYKIDVIQYVALDREKLEQKLKTPAFPIEGVQSGQITLPLKKLPPQLAALLLKTPNGSNTPILNISGKLVAFKVLKKYKRSVKFEDVKQKLLNAYINERQQAKLIEYFEKKKSEANVKILRKP